VLSALKKHIHRRKIGHNTRNDVDDDDNNNNNNNNIYEKKIKIMCNSI
jgi:hypothetical protein